jgi:hypothetical protein
MSTTRERSAGGRIDAATGDLAPALPIIAAVVYLLVSYLAILLIDVAAVGGAREWVRGVGGGTPALWVLLFEEGSPTELLQWSAVAALIVLSGLTAGQERARGEGGAASFWTLLAVGGAMMLMEDAGNVRHRLVFYVETFVGLPRTGPFHLAVEAVWFAAIAAVLAVAVVRFGRPVLRERATALRFGLAGATCYVIAVLGSVTRDIGWWYADAGRFIEVSLLRTRLLVPDGWSREHVHFFLMDHVVEESLELLGASLLLGAVIAYRRSEA